jgi:superfamily II DNA or RNA helicase
MDSGVLGANKRSKWFVPLTSPVVYESRRGVPIDPYLMGILLGDGGLNHAVILTNEEESIIDAVRGMLPDGVSVRRADALNYRLAGKGRVNPLRKQLDLMGLRTKSEGKFIPRAFKEASVQNRISLLCGLMDADGYVNADGIIQFTTVSPRLCSDVRELVNGLGGVARLSSKIPTYTHNGELRIGQRAYTLTLALPNALVPFRYSRKLARWKPREKYEAARSIRDIELVGTKPCRCIRVENDDGLYLTNDYIVTHNTVSAIGVARHLACDRTLIITKASIKHKWAREIDHFDARQVDLLEGTSPRPISTHAAYAVANYDILEAWEQPLLEWSPEFVVSDEFHYIANPKAQRSMVTKRLMLKAPFACGLTGTPVRNRPKDLWNLLDALRPGWWGSQWDFERVWCRGHKKPVTRFVKGKRKTWIVWEANGVSNEQSLHARLQSIMLRRLKKDVEKDLPPTSRTTFPTILTDAARAAYDKLASKLADALKTKKYDDALSLVTLLRQESSLGRIDSTVERTRELLANEPERPVVVFAYFLDSMDKIQAALKDYRVARIDGDTHPAKRFAINEQFQNGALDVLVGQVVACGEGIDLFRSDVTLHHDVTWSPFESIQAEGRIDRIGQTRPTTHTYFLGQNTIDERVLNITMKKLAMSTSLLDSGEKVDRALVASLKADYFGQKTTGQRKLA